MQCRKALTIPLVHPITLALPVELGISGRALLVECEYELYGFGIAVVGSSVEEGTT